MIYLIILRQIIIFAGNSELLRLVNTHGKVFYSQNEFDRFFNNSSLN